MGDDAPLLIHATAVALGPRAVLIRGASGAGKSALGLQLMAHGAELVADDRTELRAEGGRVIVRAPAAIAGLIEARGMGILRAVPRGQAAVALVVDLDRVAGDRMPQVRKTSLLGIDLPLFHSINGPHFAAAILQYLRCDQGEAT